MIPAPPDRYTVSEEYVRPDGRTGYINHAVAAFDDDGNPLIAAHGRYSTGLILASQMGGRWSLEVQLPTVIVPAESGWYAFVCWHGPDGSQSERLPVIAWQVHVDDESTGKAIVIDRDGMTCTAGWDASPHTNVVGYFHPDRLPEGNDAADAIRRFRDAYLTQERGKR